MDEISRTSAKALLNKKRLGQKSLASWCLWISSKTRSGWSGLYYADFIAFTALLSVGGGTTKSNSNNYRFLSHSLFVLASNGLLVGIQGKPFLGFVGFCNGNEGEWIDFIDEIFHLFHFIPRTQ